MSVDRSTFDEVVGRRHPDTMQIFENLDADADGKVDTFEVLLTLTLWCSATWEEKLDLLFQCFDFNRKDSLRFPELALMAKTALQTVRCFATVPSGLEDFEALKGEVAQAFTGAPSGELGQQGFAEWFGECSLAQQLKQFVEGHLKTEASEKVEVLVRERVRMLEYRVQELAQEVEELAESAEALRQEGGPQDPNQKAKWSNLWQNLDNLFVRLRTAGDSQRSEMAELTTSMAEEAADGGAVALLEPQMRAQHNKFIKEISDLEQRARGYLAEAKEVVGQLLELARCGDSRPETPSVQLPPAPKMARGSEDPEATEKRLRLLNQELRRRRLRQAVGTAGDAAATAAGPAASLQHAEVPRRSVTFSQHTEAVSVTVAAGEAEETMPAAMPIVVAFAAFDSPEGEETQMLSLRPGDEISAIGQDGAGWWYGRKTDGSEGWFPPSYVTLKEEAKAVQSE